VVSRFFIKDDFSWTEGEEKKLSGGEKVDEMLFVLEGEVNGADVGKGAGVKGRDSKCIWIDGKRESADLIEREPRAEGGEARRDGLVQRDVISSVTHQDR
jgi:hypothetical protein